MLKNSDSPDRSQLRDYDWRVQQILGSSSLANYQDKLLTLTLHLSEERDVVPKLPIIKKALPVELNENDVEKLISALENCQQTLSKGN